LAHFELHAVVGMITGAGPATP